MERDRCFSFPPPSQRGKWDFEFWMWARENCELETCIRNTPGGLVQYGIRNKNFDNFSAILTLGSKQKQVYIGVFVYEYLTGRWGQPPEHADYYAHVSAYFAAQYTADNPETVKTNVKNRRKDLAEIIPWCEWTLRVIKRPYYFGFAVSPPFALCADRSYPPPSYFNICKRVAEAWSLGNKQEANNAIRRLELVFQRRLNRRRTRRLNFAKHGNAMRVLMRANDP